jgi:uncharacterized protein YjbJ (UPF0337 family)
VCVRSGEWTSFIEPHREGGIMGVVDKAKNKVEAAKGDVKEKTGRATNDRRMQAKGKGEKVSGNVKQAGEKVKDAVRR